MLVCVELCVLLVIMLIMPPELPEAAFVGFAIGERWGQCAAHRRQASSRSLPTSVPYLLMWVQDW
jgi:hypothetical protein